MFSASGAGDACSSDVRLANPLQTAFVQSALQEQDSCWRRFYGDRQSKSVWVTSAVNVSCSAVGEVDVHSVTIERLNPQLVSVARW